MQDNILAKQYSLSTLFRFAFPNVIMMICLSLYIIVDGMFISRILGTTALSSANMVYPAICLEMAIGIMIATGGSAIIARKMGESKIDEARKNFTFLIIVEIIIGLLVAFVGNVFVEEIITFLGATSSQKELCIPYAQILFSFAPAFFLQTAFQTFMVTAGKPTLGLMITIIAGITNIFLDYIFMSPLKMGMAGAGIATGIGYCVPAIIGIIYFFKVKNNTLHFVVPKTDWKVLLTSCMNGSSEMVTNLANAVTTFLFNYTFLKYYGEAGVASITIILYFQYIFTALYFGYSNGIAPIISFKYGNKDKKQLQQIFKNSLVIIMLSSLFGNIILHLTIKYSVGIFTMDKAVYTLTISGIRFYSIAFIVMGLGIFSSALFTAFSDGKTSAIISFSRTFVFIVGAILVFPLVFGNIGVWLAVPFAEILGIVVSIFYLYKNRTYGYLYISK